MTRATKAGLVILLIVIVVVAGIVVNLIQINEAGNQLSFEGVELYSLDVSGSLIVIPTKIRIDLGVIVRNPTQYTLDIKRMTYTIFIQGKYFGEGSSRDIVLPAGSAIPIPMSLEVSVAPVGGVLMPVNKLEILAPYLALIGLVGAVTAAVAATKRRKP